jgi:hypothetical protein
VRRGESGRNFKRGGTEERNPTNKDMWNEREKKKKEGKDRSKEKKKDKDKEEKEYET